MVRFSFSMTAANSIILGLGMHVVQRTFLYCQFCNPGLLFGVGLKYGLEVKLSSFPFPPLPQFMLQRPVSNSNILKILPRYYNRLYCRTLLLTILNLGFFNPNKLMHDHDHGMWKVKNEKRSKFSFPFLSVILHVTETSYAVVIFEVLLRIVQYSSTLPLKIMKSRFSQPKFTDARSRTVHQFMFPWNVRFLNENIMWDVVFQSGFAESGQRSCPQMH